MCACFPLCLYDTTCQLCRDAKSCVSPTGNTILQPRRRKILRLYISRLSDIFHPVHMCVCFPLCLYDTICQPCRDAKSCVSPTGDTILRPRRRKILRLYIARSGIILHSFSLFHPFHMGACFPRLFTLPVETQNLASPDRRHNLPPWRRKILRLYIARSGIIFRGFPLFPLCSHVRGFSLLSGKFVERHVYSGKGGKSEKW